MSFGAQGGDLPESGPMFAVPVLCHRDELRKAASLTHSSLNFRVESHHWKDHRGLCAIFFIFFYFYFFAFPYLK